MQAARTRPVRLAAFVLLFVGVLACAGRCVAQAGPPFLTDDPETPGNQHWEINAGWIAAHNPGASSYQVPDFDINYGLGDRIQLKYELPIAVATDQNHTTRAGLGESLLGIKWRFYEHTRVDSRPGDDKAVNFSVGTYPQLFLNNPTSAVRRGVVPPGPQFLMPLESNGRIGWLRLDGEVGYLFSNQHVPQAWIRGLVAGHEFSEKTELYLELHDQQDANRIDDQPKQRSATLGLGGRQALNHYNSILLLFMGGRSFQTVTRTDGQPSWIAYLGVQFLLGPKQENHQVEKKVPDEAVR
jgi:hypothetical protein